MLQGRSMYIWNLGKCLGSGNVDDMIATARRHKISSLWPKIADGNRRFENVERPMADSLHALVAKATDAGISVLGYHVPWCANSRAAAAEVEFINDLADEFGLAGVVVDNEDGSSYFKGGADEARIYAQGLHTSMAAAGRLLVMSSNDILSAHPKSQGKVVGEFVDLNAPQVYYGRSRSVQGRLAWALKENEPITAPFFPVGAAFVSGPKATDGGCRTARDCALRAEQFIDQVSALNRKDPAKYPGYGFWNWEEAPTELWQVLARTDVFVSSEAGRTDLTEMAAPLVVAPITIAARSAPGFAHVAGPVIERLQLLLDRAGFHTVQDGDFGNKTLASLHSWQGSLTRPQTDRVTADDWQMLSAGPAPSIFDLCLQLTASFEGTGFNGAVGNFDGAGVTFGIIGFTATNGELGAIVAKANRLDPTILDRTFGALKGELVAGLGHATAEARRAWGNSISVGPLHYNLQPDWRRAFERFGREPLVRALQIERAYSVYWSAAKTIWLRYNLSSALDAALAYDIAVQNGSVKHDADVRIRARLTATTTPEQRRLIIAEEVRDVSSPNWRSDVFDRKSTIARGTGSSHGARYALSAWGLEERPVSTSDFDAPSRLGYDIPAEAAEETLNLIAFNARSATETFICEGSGEAETEQIETTTAKPNVDRVETTSHKQSRNGTRIDRIVIHYTTSRNIEGTISHFKTGTPRTSAHYIIDRDGTLVQIVPDAEAAWHAGNKAMNLRSIGIEHVARDGDKITPAQASTSLALIRWLIAQYGISVDNVIPHCCIHPTSCCGDLFHDYGGAANQSCSVQNAALHGWLTAGGVLSN